MQAGCLSSTRHLIVELYFPQEISGSLSCSYPSQGHFQATRSKCPHDIHLDVSDTSTMSKTVYPNPTDSFLLALPPFTLKSFLSFHLPATLYVVLLAWDHCNNLLASLLHLLCLFLTQYPSLLTTQIMSLPSLN